MGKKIAIISDVRGNYSALIQILQEIEDSWGKCILVSLGSMVGEGSKPLETIVEIQKKFHHILKSDSEKILAEEISTRPYGSPRFAQGMELAQKKCSKNILDWLKELPSFKKLENLLLQRNGRFDNEYFNEFEFPKGKEGVWITDFSENEFLSFSKYLCKKRVHYVFCGISPCEIFFSAKNAIKVKENYDFNANEAGNIIIIPACGSYIASSSHRNGYAIYDIEKNIFHIRYVKIEKNDFIET